MAWFQGSRKVLGSVPPSLALLCSLGSQQTGQASLCHQGDEKKHPFLLGPAASLKGVASQGWQMHTTVKNSNIPQAGHGRFAAEYTPKGSVVVQKPLVPMAKLDTLVGLSNDSTITFATEADLEKYIELAQKEGGFTREEVLHVYEHFIYGFDGKVVCLNVCTWTVNHGDNTGDGLNVDLKEHQLPGGGVALVGKAMIDINVGDELYNDYRKFVIAPFYTTYTKKHGFKDVRTATLEAVYGKAE